MLTNKNFLINFYILKENFEFTISDIYCKLVFDSLESKINDKMFIDSCNNILKNTTKEEWNKDYGYKGRPAIADWLNTFIPKMEKKRISKTEPSTGATITEITYDYPNWYLEIINNKQNYEKLTGK